MIHDDAEVAALEIRVGNGLQWLADHDPGSRFHCWWQAGFTPATPLPAHEGTPEVKADWVAYYKARQVFERLDRKLEAYEREGLSKTIPVAVKWAPAGSVR